MQLQHRWGQLQVHLLLKWCVYVHAPSGRGTNKRKKKFRLRNIWLWKWVTIQTKNLTTESMPIFCYLKNWVSWLLFFSMAANFPLPNQQCQSMEDSRWCVIWIIIDPHKTFSKFYQKSTSRYLSVANSTQSYHTSHDTFIASRRQNLLWRIFCDIATTCEKIFQTQLLSMFCHINSIYTTHFHIRLVTHRSMKCYK